MITPPKPPHGLAAIVKTFGDIESYIACNSDRVPILSPGFEKRHIISLELPTEIRTATSTGSIRCHRLLKPLFAAVFAQIVTRDAAKHIHTIDGCFVFRQKRSGNGFSTHSWGIAIDINAVTNRRGTKGDMDTAIIDIFKIAGFIWGGDWKGKMRDPMHFQYCTGY
jgi:hypothetical protein